MLRLHVVCALLGLVAAGLLLTPVYAAPFFLGGALDGGGPGASPPGSRWFTDFDTAACDQSLSGESMNEVHLDPDNETPVGRQSDAFDDGLQLVVAGKAFNDSDDTGDLVTDSGGEAVKLGPEPMAGLDVTLEWKALASTATMRTFAALRNTTGADITVPISWQTNVGSDAGTTIVGSSSGDLTFGANDVWLVTSDEGAPEGDPVNTSVLFGPGNPAVRPSSVADLFTGCGGDEGVVAEYKVTVPAGQSCYLLFFNQVNQTDAEALAAAAGFNANPAVDSELVSGIGPQLPEIANWDFKVAGPPSATTSGTTPAPTPAVAGAVRAASLPPTGGAPGDGTQVQLWAIVLGALMLSATCAFVVKATR